MFLNGGNVCNFLIHPSMQTDQHIKFAEKIGDYLNEISITSDEPETIASFQLVYENLKTTKQELCTFNEVFSFICENLKMIKLTFWLLIHILRMTIMFNTKKELT